MKLLSLSSVMAVFSVPSQNSLALTALECGIATYMNSEQQRQQTNFHGKHGIMNIIETMKKLFYVIVH